MPTINFQNCGHPPPSSNPFHFFPFNVLTLFFWNPSRKKKSWLHTVEPCQIEMMPCAARVSVGAICSPRALPAIIREDSGRCSSWPQGSLPRSAMWRGMQERKVIVHLAGQDMFGTAFSCCFSIATWRSFKNYDLLKPTWEDSVASLAKLATEHPPSKPSCSPGLWFVPSTGNATSPAGHLPGNPNPWAHQTWAQKRQLEIQMVQGTTRIYSHLFLCAHC